MSRAKDIFAAPPTPKPDTVNKAGYAAYTRPLKEQYLQTLLTNTMGNTFYSQGQDLIAESSAIHDQMMKEDPEFAAQAIVYARNEGFMRLQPIYGLVKLSSANVSLFERVFNQVIRIPSDLADFLTILESTGRGQGGRAVKRAVSSFLNRVSEYWAIKYNGRGRGFNLADAIATSHPKPKDEKQQAIFQYLLGREANMTLIPQVAAFEKLKSARSEAEKVDAIKEGRLPHEIVTGVGGLTQAVWDAVLKEMPIFALLRNLNTLSRADVLDANRQFITEKFANKEVLGKSKILPFRFAKAFKEVSEPWVRDCMRSATELTFDNLPDLNGRTLIALDISGSMSGDYLETGSVFAFAMYKKTKGNSLFYLFNTHAMDAAPSLHDSILTQASRVSARGGTNTGSPISKLLDDGERVDNIIIITDEQQNTGSPFYTQLAEYRRKVNKDTKAFVVDISPYKGAMVPKSDKNTFYIYGWSDTVLNLIAMSVDGFGTMVDKVESITI